MPQKSTKKVAARSSKRSSTARKKTKTAGSAKPRAAAAKAARAKAPATKKGTKKPTSKKKTAKKAAGAKAKKTAKAPAAKKAKAPAKTKKQKAPAPKTAKTKRKPTSKKAEKPARKPAAKAKAPAKAPEEQVTPKPAEKPLQGKEAEAPAPQAEAPPPPPKKAPPKRPPFKLNEFIVYPAHGVGQITDIEEREIAGTRLELFVISFEKDKMTLRVPIGKADSVGMRALSSADRVRSALNTLKGRARIKRTMWSRRAQEYEAKINSGDIISIAEVVRDLYRASGQPDQSYSERQLYEAALDRFVREVAAVQSVDDETAIARVEEALSESPGRGKKPIEESDSSDSVAS